MFNIPIVVFFFKRIDKTLEVIKQISFIKPSKIYLISDGPRNLDESALVNECRSKVESAISWDCEVIKNYALENKGVYDRIGSGAKWVFSLERSAIFLEDDNLPELTFFQFCKELLDKYEYENRVLWICGTNYLKKYEPEQGSSYVFSKHLFPCGWASWSHKFLKYYDGEMNNWDKPFLLNFIRKSNYYKPLMRQEFRNWKREYFNIKEKGKANSWDYQMSFSIRSNDLYGVVPKYNQITNIGVDEFSTHGGVDNSNIMTRRFCNIPRFPLEFPLIHPEFIISDVKFEKLTDRIVTFPISLRFKGFVIRILRFIFNVGYNQSLREKLLKSFKFQ